jgi:hypothetical protein
MALAIGARLNWFSAGACSAGKDALEGSVGVYSLPVVRHAFSKGERDHLMSNRCASLTIAV